jgi:uroporphyrin-III C-methyltransferase
MTESNNSSPAEDGQSPENGDVSKKSKAENKQDVKIYSLILIILILLIASGVYFVVETKDISKTHQLLGSTVENQNQKINLRINELLQKIEVLQDHIDVLADSLSDMYDNQPASNEDWALAEAEYLLIIANHRLLLEQDVHTALTAMEAAALRLEGLGSVGLIPVREQITADINSLKAVNTVDITGLSIYLADLIDRIEDMPVRKMNFEKPVTANDQSQQSIPGENESTLRKIISQLWQELKSLIVIKKSGEINNVLLLPDQEYFLYQNLRIELENARLSVLRRNTENLQSSIKLITNWLQTYFDTGDNGVANMLDSLNRMSVLILDPVLPDISSSLETLRAYIRQHETAKVFMDDSVIQLS